MFEKIQNIFYEMNDRDKKYFNHSLELKKDIDKIYLVNREMIDDIAVCEMFYLDVEQIVKKRHVGFSLLVHPLYRNKGYATRLIKNAIDFCNSQGFVTLTADIYNDNDVMQYLLNKLCFKREYQHDNMVVYTFYLGNHK